MNCPACNTNSDATFGKCPTCGAALSPIPVGVGFVVASRFDLVESLGMGGMGAVFRAHDRVLEKPVAIKILREDIADWPDMLRRFRSEIVLAQKVRHPNVCAIHHYGEDGGLRYILMELVKGHDLRHILRQGFLLAEEAFDVSVQITEGLQAIHEAQIIHRDLKSSNVMLDEQGRVRLMDFGIAKDHGNKGALATLVTNGTLGIIGTPDYMSPEQARGGKLDFRSDLYSLGVLIFEIFTGRVPFHGATLFSTLMKHIQEEPPLEGPEAVRIPRPLIPVLRKTLAKEPGDRYQTAGELVQALEQARDTSKGPESAASSIADLVAPEAPTEYGAPGSVVSPVAATAEWESEFPTAPVPVSATLSGSATTEMRPPRTPAPPPPPPLPRVTHFPAEGPTIHKTSATAAVAKVPPRLPSPPTPARRGRSQPVAAVAAVLGVAAVVAGVLGFSAYRLLGLHRGGATDSTASATLKTPPPPTQPPTPRPTVSTSTPSAPPTVPPSTTRPTPPPPPTPTPPVTTVPVRPRLPPTPPGVLQLRVSPWAEVQVDERPLGTTPLKPLSLSAGYHTVRLVHPDFGTVDRMVRIEEGQTLHLDVDLKGETGLVQVLVTPWAEVTVDGRSLGTTPLKPIALKPGGHSLRFTHPRFPAVDRRVEVRKGETVKIEVDMAGQQ